MRQQDVMTPRIDTQLVESAAWDSEFFGRRLGVLRDVPRKARDLRTALDAARDAGFEHVTCRVGEATFDALPVLGLCGFYVTDSGIVWRAPAAAIAGRRRGASIETPGEDAIGTLLAAMSGLFKDSRFYHDPFFSRVEADRLFDAWIANSVRGQAADATYAIGGDAFIACKRLDEREGDIRLVGVRAERQGEGLGRELIAAAMEWGATIGMASMTVRTQARNVGAMNFYRSLGFTVAHADMTLCKMLGR